MCQPQLQAWEAELARLPKPTFQASTQQEYNTRWSQQSVPPEPQFLYTSPAHWNEFLQEYNYNNLPAQTFATLDVPNQQQQYQYPTLQSNQTLQSIQRKLNARSHSFHQPFSPALPSPPQDTSPAVQSPQISQEQFVCSQDPQIRPETRIVQTITPETIIIDDDDDEEDDEPVVVPSQPSVPEAKPLKKARKDYSWLEGNTLRFEDAVRRNVRKIQVHEILNAGTLTSKKIVEKGFASKSRGLNARKPNAKLKRKRDGSEVRGKRQTKVPRTTQILVSEETSRISAASDKENGYTAAELEEYEHLFDMSEEGDKENGYTPAELEEYEQLFNVTPE